MNRRLAASLAVATLWPLLTAGSCATTSEPRVVTHEVRVPVPVKCTPDIGPEPTYPDTDAALKAAPGLFERVKLLVAGRILRIQRDVVKSAALKACEG